MRRRQFITLIGGAAATWPLAARAQQAGRMARVGVFVNGLEADPQMQMRLAAFRQGLESLGWSEGRNVHLDVRFGGSDPGRYQALAKDLVALHPDVILATTTPIAVALQRETRTIPIVFTSVSDPVGSGLVASLARPGGNITGLLFYEASITTKWISMLKEIVPGLARVALMANPKTTPYDYFLRAAEAAAPSLAIEIVPSRTETAADIDRNVEAVARTPNSGIVFLPDGTSFLYRDVVIAAVARFRVPAVYAIRAMVEAGGLMYYGTDIVEQNRQVASYVDRILRGGAPADLPVEAPTKYETVLNLKVAKALGLEVPASLLVRADEVIE
jgi:putative ABC transport system substrate-binding protein